MHVVGARNVIKMFQWYACVTRWVVIAYYAPQWVCTCTYGMCKPPYIVVTVVSTERYGASTYNSMVAKWCFWATVYTWLNWRVYNICRESQKWAGSLTPSPLSVPVGTEETERESVCVCVLFTHKVVLCTCVVDKEASSNKGRTRLVAEPRQWERLYFDFDLAK